MEQLQAQHRKEQRDLQSRITQKKKSASKKTRKGVNAECEQLELDLKQSQEREIAELDGSAQVDQSEQLENDIDELNGDAVVSNGDIEQSEGPRKILDSLESLSVSPSATKGKIQQNQSAIEDRKPNRQKARLARRAAEQEALVAEAAQEAANLPDLREQERATITKMLDREGLRERVIRPDGHCLYSAVADQLSRSGKGLKPQIAVNVAKSTGDKDTQEGYRIVRGIAADYISQHPDDFVPFLEEPLDDYTNRIRETAEWGGHLELLALAKAYDVDINVLQGDGRVEKIQSKSENDGRDLKQMWLAYYRHHFGLGEHYNSLYKIT
ncbi:MAG: hypothetical protein M4579_006308 [Chaenotheca gracillima]|nr:MAG: hypothetical protein M4579_006308 [Chaenotheca gracillima]